MVTKTKEDFCKAGNEGTVNSLVLHLTHQLISASLNVCREHTCVPI